MLRNVIADEPATPLDDTDRLTDSQPNATQFYRVPEHGKCHGSFAA